MEILDSDILILGTGIAGFTSALHASEASGKLRISMISKLHAMRSHSVAAEGGRRFLRSLMTGKGRRYHIGKEVR